MEHISFGETYTPQVFAIQCVTVSCSALLQLKEAYFVSDVESEPQNHRSARIAYCTLLVKTYRVYTCCAV
jgi:hypothetical protein